MRRFGWVVVVAAVTACGSSGSGGSTQSSPDGVTLMAGFDPGPAPAAGTGFQVVMPIVNNIEAGQSYEYCTWSDVTLDQDVWIKSSKGQQTETGHHIIIYYTLSPVKAGTTQICKDADMPGFRYALAAFGEGAAGTSTTLPGDLAVKVPKGAQIVINHHYLNASGKNVPQAQSSVNVEYAPAGTKVVESSSMAFLDTSMTVPKGLQSVDVTCTMNQDYATWMIFPHMHQWGQHITVDHIAGTTSKRLFDVDWNPTYTFTPPTMTEDPTQPYVLHQGDQLHVHCDYNNNTTGALNFGAEMCVAYAAMVDSAGVGNMDCDQGHWSGF